MWNKDWGVTHVTASSKPKPSPEFPDLATCLECHKEPVTQSSRRRKDQTISKKGTRNSLEDGYMNNRTTSSFLIAVMSF